MKTLLKKNNEIKEKIKEIQLILFNKESNFDYCHKEIFKETNDNLNDILLDSIIIRKNLELLEKIEEQKEFIKNKIPEKFISEINEHLKIYEEKEIKENE